jgi:hypothetical protein
MLRRNARRGHPRPLAPTQAAEDAYHNRRPHPVSPPVRSQTCLPRENFFPRSFYIRFPKITLPPWLQPPNLTTMCIDIKRLAAQP